MGIMGSIPLVILALLLPFLKAAAVDGVAGDGFSGDVMHDGGFAHDSVIGHDGMMGHDGVVRAPSGYHHVNGYTRIGADGQPEYVQGYIRSNPDGILENNLSYHVTHSHPTEGSVYENGAVHEYGVVNIGRYIEPMDSEALFQKVRWSFSMEQHAARMLGLIYGTVFFMTSTVMVMYVYYK